ncbi:MAG: hypothetical protein DRI46_11775, partial [Chloroflexi bacterium]
MAKLQRKNLSFQAGELSPRFFGRSDTEIYAKGLAVAENVYIDKRGGAFKRGGLEHVAQIDANNARVFTLQTSRVQYYTVVVFYDLILGKGQMLIVAPGASLLGSNLLLNGNFSSGELNWNSAIEPISSQVLFNIGEVTLRPEQGEPQLVDNGNFQQQDLEWTVRESHAQSQVTFTVGSCTMIPRTTNGEYAGIAQELTTATPGDLHSIAVTGEFGSNEVSVRIGNAEGDTTYFDGVVNGLNSGQAIEFTPAASPFWITVECIFPNSNAVISNISVLEKITKTAAISQEATVVAAITDTHLVIIGQASVQRIHVLIGTTDGASDILAIDSSDHEIIATFVPNNATYWVTVLADGDEIVEAK